MDSWKAVILAAGRGSRMRSSVPKVLQPICGRAMVGLVADALRGAGLDDLVAVVAPGARGVGEAIGGCVSPVEQAEQLGTGHALAQAGALLAEHRGHVLAINGDVPLVTPATISALVNRHESTGACLTILTCDGPPSHGMGRVVRDDNGAVAAIVEEADLDARSACSAEANAGVYCVQSPWVWSALSGLPTAPNGEVYLTSLVAEAVRQGHAVESLCVSDASEALGVNDGVQLDRAREAMRRRINDGWRLRGVSVMEPAYIDVAVEIGEDSVLYPNSFLQGRTSVGKGCAIGPGSMVTDSSIADGCRILNSVVEGAVLEEGVDVGPFSHVRPDSHVETGVHVGNFAEIKNSRLGRGTKMGHFSYVGDSWVGAGVNIGAGAVTCNFDGVDKHRTIVEDGAFIGSDSMLIAPVRIGAGASTGAGSVVTKDVPPGARVAGAPARIIGRGSPSELREA
ncbi:MAG: bifunctional UDP-N-acetylglucosamine diphosphorylase/glucosamine-1-phosphate N-acetyltransferase GlmU [Chloroflexota bacterium]|nr:bifunctional UDP-N-acetylglucosamine diphosphorylase/glucosamine-1-phosphate N-acetyltransferase GlmU [Chloroflexota bacterium]MDE2941447.1 bifunctional UDP-N-acetylglucosamine diphosphorylase/glucosamine-1-phosphate N-acetyltransferase GlmU [Chloroflexota bacterium]MDE3267635.1 bifunctional UDP-N-acetylglucosamine diphosphorylase/glucosamine-1-phosphate N-acetyltransferase GlmU [Chloroflexota bacterium]